MSELIISVSGLRGIIGETLTPEIAIRYVLAFVATLPEGPLVITRDGRTTGPMLSLAIQSALLSVGRNVIVAGAAATPTTGVLVQTHQAAGGIQISASHNPPEYNGIKLFSAAGRVIPAAPGLQVLERYQKNEIASYVSHEKIGFVSTLHEATAIHWERIEKTVNVQKIRDQKFRVLLDSNHGAGGLLGRVLLEKLGCEFVIQGETPDGLFAHPAEPTPDNLVSVLSSVTKNNAAIGFCQDPDADRLAVIDENGRYLGEEYTLAICTDHILRATPGPIVVNCSSSRMTQDLAEKYNVPFYRSAVGEANVVDKMIEVQAVFGGEGNGGAIDPRVIFVRDSFVAMALLLDTMASRKMKISQLADELPAYAMYKAKVQIERDKIEMAFEMLASHFSDAKVDRLDGLRLDWEDRWLLVRASNTEPIIRIMGEAQTADKVRAMSQEAATILAQV